MLPLPQICRSGGYGLLDTAGASTSSLSACPKKVTKTIVDICKDIGRCATNWKTTQGGGLLINPQKLPESHGSYSSLKESPAAVQGPQGSHYRKQVPQGLFLLMVLIHLARSSPPPRSRPRTMGPSRTGSGSRVGGIRGLGTGPGNIRPTGPAETHKANGTGNQTADGTETRQSTGWEPDGRRDREQVQEPDWRQGCGRHRQPLQPGPGPLMNRPRPKRPTGQEPDG